MGTRERVTLFGPAPRLRGWRSPGLPWVILAWVASGVVVYLVEAVVPYYAGTRGPQISGPLGIAALLPFLYLLPPTVVAVAQLVYGDLSRRRKWALLACLAVVAAEIAFVFSPAGASVTTWLVRD